jgi:hypothetical protein
MHLNFLNGFIYLKHVRSRKIQDERGDLYIIENDLFTVNLAPEFANFKKNPNRSEFIP